MGKKIITQTNEQYGFWKVVEPNVINPETTAKQYIGKAVFSKCICTKCNKTIRYIRNNELKKQTQCRSCSNVEKNIQNSSVKIHNKYGLLEVIGDAGFKIRNDGSRRHFSLCQCKCGNIIEVMDNSLQSGNTTSCGCVGSKGELVIKKILDNNNIIYDKDSIFPELLAETGRRLRFDFIIYNENGSINRFVEFDGNQHKTGMWGGSWSNLEPFEAIRERDNIKNNFCLKHNYILVRLPYFTLKNMTLDKIMGDKYIYKGED